MRLAIPLALIFAAVPSAVRADEPVALKWKLKEGDTFYSKTALTQNQTVGVIGMKVDVVVDTETILKYNVKAVKQDATTIEVTYVKSKSEAKGVPLKLGELGDKVKGAVVTLTVNDKGAVTKVEGADKLAEKFKDLEGLEKSLALSMFGEAQVKEVVGFPFTILPEKPVKVGDTWAKDEKADVGGLEVSGKTTFKVESLTDSAAKISTKADMKLKAGANVGGGLGLPFKISKVDMKVEPGTGAVTFDVKAGRLKEFTQETAVSGTMTASLEGTDIPLDVKMKQKMAITISEKAPATD